MWFKQQQNFGFTLIELLISIALAAVILTQAVPSFNTLVQNNRLIAQKNEFLSSLNLARSEAIKRGVRVTVCASSNQTSCNNTDWEKGWIVFSDVNADATLDAGSGACSEGEDCLLRVAMGLIGGNTLTASHFSNTKFIQYTPRGELDSAGTFTFCDQRGAKHAQATNLYTVGRVISASDSGTDSIVNDIQNKNVVCLKH
ncbi:GspH/FimT family pseudopilin [Kaarinaea lacus]